tara:strand:+ start:1129 stop:1935 length:807 start_codon:yes stop_codon:yes gene_type:complete
MIEEELTMKNIMSLFKKQKPKIEFCSEIIGIEKIMPIIPAKDLPLDWVKRAIANVKKEGLIQTGINTKAHITRCPGIISSRTQGWIVRLHQDLELTINGNDINWKTPIDDQKYSFDMLEPTVNIFQDYVLHQFMKRWPKGANPMVVKINTPWHVRIPKGYKMLQTMPAFGDENRFHTITGIVEEEHGIVKLNFPMYWFEQGKTLLEQGTPLAQLILIKQEHIEMEQSHMEINPKFKEIFQTNWYNLRSTFTRNYTKIKDRWRNITDGR